MTVLPPVPKKGGICDLFPRAPMVASDEKVDHQITNLRIHDTPFGFESSGPSSRISEVMCWVLMNFVAEHLLENFAVAIGCSIHGHNASQMTITGNPKGCCSHVRICHRHFCCVLSCHFFCRLHFHQPIGQSQKDGLRSWGKTFPGTEKEATKLFAIVMNFSLPHGPLVIFH